MTFWFPKARLLAGSLTAASILLVAGACSSGTSSGSDGPPASDPTSEAAPLPEGLEGPVTGGTYDVAYLAMPEGWEEEFGYSEEEYYFSGNAASYELEGTAESDGEWSVTPATETADFATRILVRRPVDDADFNGTLVVEWLNVSAGRDSDPDFGFLAEELMGQGYAYVAVSAQSTGVEPGGLGIPIPGVPPEALAPLKEWDPERYGDLSHPGDEYSYDMFTQASQIVVDDGGPLAGLDVEHVIAAGESQSASRMVTYVNAVQPITEAFDGFLVHSRGNSGAGLNEVPGQELPGVAQIRADVAVPVFQFQTETDLLSLLDFGPARQPDAENLVTWEVAGTGHADKSTLDYGVLAGKRWTDANVDLSTECGTVNDGPQQPVVQTAFAALNEWIVDGTRPAESAQIETDENGDVVRDASGIALGGIRTPAVDVPVSILSGENMSESIICVLFGSERPLTPEELAERYTDQADYVAQVTASAEAAVDAGHLLPRHAEAMITEAESVEIG